MELDPVIHQPARLRIMATLAGLSAGDLVEFNYLRESLALTEGNLGAHLQKLEAAGFIRLKKDFIARKPRTRIQLTAKGRAGFEEHVAQLRQILNGP